MEVWFVWETTNILPNCRLERKQVAWPCKDKKKLDVKELKCLRIMCGVMKLQRVKNISWGWDSAYLRVWKMECTQKSYFVEHA